MSEGSASMLSRRGICRPSRNEAKELARFRADIAESMEFLRRLPRPDTFIGRKTQEPFPIERKIVILKRLDD